MNSDFVIGTRNPGILMARLIDDAYDRSRVAYSASGETAEPGKEQVNLATVEVRPHVEVRPGDAEKVEETKPVEHGRRERGRGPEAQEGDLSFDDLLDILNPLQHLPIISHIYRAVSGDEIKGFAEVAGSAIFGGPIGVITGVFNAMFEDETGKSAPETMLASLFGIGDDAPKLGEAKLETQLAEAQHNIVTDESAPGQVQVASQTKIPKTLDAQVAGAMLPPIPPSPVQTAEAKAKAPFGGVMDMSTIKAASQSAAAVTVEKETPRASPLPRAPSPGYAATPHPPTEINGQKFYSLAGVRRTGDSTVSMPIHSGPDVRLKPISRQAASGIIIPTQTIGAASKVADPEAAKALGLSVDVSSVAALGLKDTDPMFSLDDVDLQPAYGQGSQGVPPALIEDMMRMGLDKYQKGLESGTLSTRPGVDIRG